MCTPTLVAHNVRDVALGRYVGVIIDHSGAVRVSGLVRRDNKECYVYGFYDEPYSLIKLPIKYHDNVNTTMANPFSFSSFTCTLHSPTLSSFGTAANTAATNSKVTSTNIPKDV